MSSSSRDHDIVVFGVTGFVGVLVAEHLAEHAPEGTRIALAGRSRGKVERARDGLPSRAHDWPILVADSTDPDSLATMAGSTRVVVTTVGPYLRHGLPVVEACARAGTHYADLTGETPFIRQAIDRYDDVAQASGARIVHGCGYDSIPSDIGMLTLHRQVQADDAGTLSHVLAVARAKGGVSGGTVESMRGIVELAASDPSVRRLLGDPYSLSPDHDAESTAPQPSDSPAPTRLSDGRWIAPFPMASVNSRIVRRSNALQGWAYGHDLRYGEAMGVGRGARGAMQAVGLTAGLGLGA
ncbi:trans-acting enoyl reductase family protein, partial [Actinotalea sp. C106]|uniref:saccharopine dehydrogenase family protein n=1 Tax=Actinotalea sp. C106 TaxID=2908644 RepID=UPI00202938F0